MDGWLVLSLRYFHIISFNEAVPSTPSTLSLSPALCALVHIISGSQPHTFSDASFPPFLILNRHRTSARISHKWFYFLVQMSKTKTNQTMPPHSPQQTTKPNQTTKGRPNPAEHQHWPEMWHLINVFLEQERKVKLAELRSSLGWHCQTTTQSATWTLSCEYHWGSASSENNLLHQTEIRIK